MSAAVKSIVSIGSSGVLIDVECSLSNNIPNIIIVGFANRAVDEAKERIRGAFANSRIMLPRKRITVNLAPADMPKRDSAFDLAIAVAILLASEQIPPLQGVPAFLGELSLEGDVRPIRGIIGKILAGRQHGITEFFIPTANIEQAKLVPGVRLMPVRTLQELYGHFTGGRYRIEGQATGAGWYPDTPLHRPEPEVLLSDIMGQSRAKQALIIAAAGGHNVFFSGPPGTGKSMLAKALPGLLPLLSREEMLEVTHLHSLSRQEYEYIITERPFRAPHHSASHVAITGGGLNLRPGEISLAHRGILFFDELPEFGRQTLEALRQPLEDRIITVARAKDSALYPANFILVATANPCPCGYYGTTGLCRCAQYQIVRYQQKLSGPIMDRIDLFATVDAVEHTKLLGSKGDRTAELTTRQNIAEARQRQQSRYRDPAKLNADMNNRDIRRHGQLTAEAKALLDRAAQRFNVSARSYMRSIKVARTIADLAASTEVSEAHVSEALAYRDHHR